jgi:hypothetical protein
MAVFVFQSLANDVIVSGSDENDSIIITEDAAGTQWEVQGISDTSVNGTANGVAIISKPAAQDAYIFLDGGNDSLIMRGVNQATGAGAVTFTGRTFINMGFGNDTVSLGSFDEPIAGDFNFIASPGTNGSNANSFAGGVSVELAGGAASTAATDASNLLEIANSDFGSATANGRLDVEGGPGGDVVRLRGVINYGGSISINTGPAADRLIIGGRGPEFQIPENPVPPLEPRDAVQLGGTLYLDAGDGPDLLVVENVLAVGNIVASGGGGDDSIRFGSGPEVEPARVGASARGDIVIYGGDGTDTVTVNQATTVNSFLANLGDAAPAGAGNKLTVHNSSFSNDAAILGGAQSDLLELRAVNLVTNLYIQTGGGNDTVDLQGTLVTAGLLTIDTSAGSDNVRVDNSNIRTLALFTGDGNDTVTLSANLIDDFFADLGAGNDSMSSESTFRLRAFVRGGPGVNTRSGSNFATGGNFVFEGF